MRSVATQERITVRRLRRGDQVNGSWNLERFGRGGGGVVVDCDVSTGDGREVAKVR